ncbi:MAG: ATP synthase F1 subunit delta [Coriobacteriia bacterium]|nr:ATP synthase F1 subunit delta [Coriobacteriia bacterium]
MRDDRATQIKKAKVYAEALVMSALKINGIREALDVRVDLDSALEASMYNAPLIEFLSNQETRNTDVVFKALDGMSKALLDTLKVMIDNKDGYLLIRVVETYNEILEQKLGVVVVDVYTVVKLDDKLREQITQKAERELESKVLLSEHINDTMIGGVILSAKGRIVDMSVYSLLRKAELELTSMHQAM